jgi:hypothetical protein
LLVTGCPGETEPVVPPDAEPPACTDEFVGDPEAPVEIELTNLDADDQMVDLVEGGDVDLIEPPQGGQVIFLGVRAKNLDPCAVRLKGVIRDPRTGKVAFDTRTVKLRLNADGFATSDRHDIASFANVPVCPWNAWNPSTDAFDAEFELEVGVTDRDDRKASAVIRATPRCAEPELEDKCKCICQFGYVTGMSCDTNGGGGGAGGGP